MLGDRVGVHETRIRELFEQRCDFPGRENGPESLVLIAFTNRCGSTYLGELLRGTGNFGGLHEHLNWDVVSNLSQKRGLTSFPEYVGSLEQEFHKGRAFFGFKASCDQLLMLLRFGVELTYPKLKVIHIERGDVVAQAVSFSIADQTKQWTSQQEGNGVVPTYSESDIQNRISGANAGNNCIRETVSAFQLDMHHVLYEDLVENPKSILKRICSWLDVEFDEARPLSERLKKQSSEYNFIFSERFRASRRSALLGGG